VLFHNSKYLPAQLIGCLKISKYLKEIILFKSFNFNFNSTFLLDVKSWKKDEDLTFFCTPAINLSRQANY